METIHHFRIDDGRKLNDGDLELLISNDQEIKLSLLMPVQKEPDKRDENRIRIKNLIQATEAALLELKIPVSDIDQLLEPAAELINGGSFPEIDGSGLALYLAKEFLVAFELPYAVEQLSTVGPQFHIKPLLPLRASKDYYVLILSQQAVRLLHANQYEVERINLQDVPQSLSEALRWDDPEKQLQWHSQTSQRGNGRGAMFHGHGTATSEAHKENLLRYFQLLDQGVSKILATESSPLILAGIDFLLPLYRQANSYGKLIDEEITGSLEHLRDEEVQEKSWPIIQSHLKQQRETAVARYHEMAAKDLGTADLQEILNVAYQGRVDTLFVATDRQKWGQYDPQTGHITHEASRKQPGDIDLLNLAAIYTIRNRGQIQTSACENLPGQESLAAIIRF